jgi:hypothetical protein
MDGFGLVAEKNIDIHLEQAFGNRVHANIRLLWIRRPLQARAGAYVGNWLQSFREFPPRQKPCRFNLHRVMEPITKAAGDKGRHVV